MCGTGDRPHGLLDVRWVCLWKSLSVGKTVSDMIVLVLVPGPGPGSSGTASARASLKGKKGKSDRGSAVFSSLGSAEGAALTGHGSPGSNPKGPIPKGKKDSSKGGKGYSPHSPHAKGGLPPTSTTPSSSRLTHAASWAPPVPPPIDTGVAGNPDYSTPWWDLQGNRVLLFCQYVW